MQNGLYYFHVKAYKKPSHQHFLDNFKKNYKINKYYNCIV